jgi:hypothetical protein
MMKLLDPYIVEKAVKEMTQLERKKFVGTEKEFKRFIKRKIDQKIPSLLTSLRKLMIKQLFALVEIPYRAITLFRSFAMIIID